MRRRDEREAEHERATRPPAPAAPAPADRVLALQQAAGNHAVAGMLAREAAQKEKPRYAVAIEEIGRIPVLSFRLGGDRAVTPGSGANVADPKEIAFHSELGEHSTSLVQAFARGTHWERAVIHGPGVKWTFSDVFVGSYEAGGVAGEEERPTERWSLSAAKVAFS